MVILALDTSSAGGSAAVVRARGDEVTVVARAGETTRTQVERLPSELSLDCPVDAKRLPGTGLEIQRTQVSSPAPPLCQAPGATPISRVNAREKVDSDS